MSLNASEHENKAGNLTLEVVLSLGTIQINQGRTALDKPH